MRTASVMFRMVPSDILYRFLWPVTVHAEDRVQTVATTAVQAADPAVAALAAGQSAGWDETRVVLVQNGFQRAQDSLVAAAPAPVCKATRLRWVKILQ